MCASFMKSTDSNEIYRFRVISGLNIRYSVKISKVKWQHNVYKFIQWLASAMVQAKQEWSQAGRQVHSC